MYRNNCRSFQNGLVLYPDAPAPVSGSANINIKCVNNGVVLGSPLVTCRSDGTWATANPVCRCSPGYEDRQTECFSKFSVNMYMYTCMYMTCRVYTL